MHGRGTKVVEQRGVEVVAASISITGDQITTIKATMPAIVASRLDAYQMLNVSWASSGNIPIEEQLEQVEQSPFIPMHIEQNQADVEINKDHAHEVSQWVTVRDSVLEQARNLLRFGAHNEWVASALLETFSWRTVLMTATDWDEFFTSQTGPNVHPELRIIVEMMQEAYKSTLPRLVREGEWHLPFVQPDERDGVFEHSDIARKISAARCFMLNNLTQGGQRDIETDLRLFELLVRERRLSPLGHVATPFTRAERRLRDTLGNVAITAALKAQFVPWEIQRLVDTTEFSDNFRGWTQLRSMPEKYGFSQAGRS